MYSAGRRNVCLCGGPPPMNQGVSDLPATGRPASSSSVVLLLVVTPRSSDCPRPCCASRPSPSPYPVGRGDGGFSPGAR